MEKKIKTKDMTPTNDNSRQPLLHIIMWRHCFTNMVSLYKAYLHFKHLSDITKTIEYSKANKNIVIF